MIYGNLKSDGSEDDKIHCFKKKGPCAAGAALLKDQRPNNLAP